VDIGREGRGAAEGVAGAGVDGDIGAAYGFEDGERVGCGVGEGRVAEYCADAEEFDVRVQGGEEDCEGVVVAGVAVEPDGDWFDHCSFFFELVLGWRWCVLSRSCDVRGFLYAVERDGEILDLKVNRASKMVSCNSYFSCQREKDA